MLAGAVPRACACALHRDRNLATVQEASTGSAASAPPLLGTRARAIARCVAPGRAFAAPSPGAAKHRPVPEVPAVQARRRPRSPQLQGARRSFIFAYMELLVVTNDLTERNRCAPLSVRLILTRVHRCSSASRR